MKKMSHNFSILMTIGILHPDEISGGLPCWLSGKESAGEVGLIPRSGRSPEEEMATPSSILAWEIPWTEASDRLPSRESQKSQIQLNN